MTFETYYPRSDKKLNKVAISKYHITLAPNLVEKIGGNNVELAYDAESRTIRIIPAQEGKGLNISKNKIGAKGFFEHFGLQIKGKYEARHEEKDKAIYVQIV